MKNKCILLLKTQLINEFTGKNRSKGRTAAQIGIGLVVVMAAVYSFMMAYGLGSIGLSSLIPGYTVALTSILMLFFTAVKTNGVLFAYKEYDFLMSVPVKTGTVIASRFLTMYLLNTLLAALVMLPMGAGYVICNMPGILFYAQWIIGILIVPLIPTTLAAMLGTLIILFSTRFKYANAVVTILSITVVAAVLILSMNAGKLETAEIDVSQVQTLGDAVLVQIHRLYPPARLYSESINGSRFFPLVLLAAGSILWYTLFVKLTAVVYKKLNTSLMTWHSRSDYRLTELKASSQTGALCKKDLKRFFSSTIYCMNMGMGCIMTLIMAGALLFIGKDTLNALFESPQAYDIVLRVLPFALGAVVSMTCTTCISLSMEGKNLWIIKSLPIPDPVIIKSKVSTNLALQIPVILIAALAVNIRLPLPPVIRLMVFITPVVWAAFTTVLGMLINLRLPDYGWTSETALVKQSLPAMAGMLGSMLAGLIPAGLIILLKSLDTGLVTIVITAVILCAGVILWNYVKRQNIPV